MGTVSGKDSRGSSRSADIDVASENVRVTDWPSVKDARQFGWKKNEALKKKKGEQYGNRTGKTGIQRLR